MSADSTTQSEREKADSNNSNETETGSGKSDLQVHSANSWECADLGDSKRNEKFLRLMGAAKKEHHGKFVIGDHEPVHTRKKKDSDQLKDDLAEQYEHSLEHRLAGGPRGHLGLGFHPQAQTDTPDEPGEKGEANKSQETSEADGKRQTSSKSEGEQQTSESDDEADRPEGKGEEPGKTLGAGVSRKRQSEQQTEKGVEQTSPAGEKKLKFVSGSS